VVVSRKVSKSAVQRNRIRRRVYEAFQAESAGIGKPYDLVFTVFNDQVLTCEFAGLQKQVANLLHKANVTSGHAIVSTEGKEGKAN